MKNKKFLFSNIFVILAIIFSVVYVLSVGSHYTMHTFIRLSDAEPPKTEVTMQPEGVVELENVRLENGELVFDLRAVGNGKTTIRAGYLYSEATGMIYTMDRTFRVGSFNVILEQIDGIFLKVKSLQELVGRKLVWEEASNEYGNAGALNVIECEMINNAELTIEGIENGSMTVYWKGHGDIRRNAPFNVDVPFETRVTIPLSESEMSDASDSVVLPLADQKEEGNMNPSGSNSAEYSLPVETYKSFIRQMADWYSGGELPTAAGQDLRFILELQKQKLHALGLDMKFELPKKGAGRNRWIQSQELSARSAMCPITGY